MYQDKPAISTLMKQNASETLWHGLEFEKDGDIFIVHSEDVERIYGSVDNFIMSEDILDDEKVIIHFGTKRHSGRYPYGSGDNPYQHSSDFGARFDELKKAGATYTDPTTGRVYTGDQAVMRIMGLSSTEYRDMKSLIKDEKRIRDYETAKSMREHGATNVEIAKKLGYPGESSVRSLLNENSIANTYKARTTAETLKKYIDEYGIIDVGSGVEMNLGISKEKLREALLILKEDGYLEYTGRIPQVTNSGKMTTVKTICAPGTEHKEIFDTKNIHYINDIESHDGGETFDPKFVYPKSMDSNRLTINYAEDGGIKKDGLIEIRPGVQDLDLGGSNYAQVRILVDGTHYIKGMAVYSDDLPEGKDIRFNTNKTQGTPMTKVLKQIKDDPDNPFGSLIKTGVNDPDNPTVTKGGQSYYIDKKTGKKELSLINKRAEEGDWGEWADKLSSQFLSKQNEYLIKRQLDITKKDKRAELDEILAYTNPTVKKSMLMSFADDCDASAVHLKAAALPRQKYQVILPLTTIKDTEIYAPNYRDGETVALIRHPHGGIFEIPVLKVNNKQAEGQRLITKNPLDAVGISAKVAERLSGADFDGDTVMVIPCNSLHSNVRISTRDPLKDLVGYDPKDIYGTEERGKDSNGKPIYYNTKTGNRVQPMKNTQAEMGKVSNLITDMTLHGGATEAELARAVRHSMTVIDAEKHKLDWKQSEKDNDIDGLKRKYQQKENDKYGGASTLISKSKSNEDVPRRQGSPRINLKGKDYYDPSRPEGAYLWKTADDLDYQIAKVDRQSKQKDIPNATIRITKKGKTYVQMDGSDDWLPTNTKAKLEEGTRVRANVETKQRIQVSTKMAETDDARTLISKANTIQENLYADYANSLKYMANEARKTAATTKANEWNPTAAQTYKTEVDSLKTKLQTSQANAPKERQAQAIANSVVAAKKNANPDMTKKEIQKEGQRALAQARVQTGAKRTTIDISDKEWEAIQAGAVNKTTLEKILHYTDTGRIRQLATPDSMKTLSDAKISKIAQMKASGNYTNLEIAEAIGVSSTTVGRYLNGEMG